MGYTLPPSKKRKNEDEDEYAMCAPQRAGGLVESLRQRKRGMDLGVAGRMRKAVARAGTAAVTGRGVFRRTFESPNE
jgi:hypothetical protein